MADDFNELLKFYRINPETQTPFIKEYLKALDDGDIEKADRLCIDKAGVFINGFKVNPQGMVLEYL